MKKNAPQQLAFKSATTEAPITKPLAEAGLSSFQRMYNGITYSNWVNPTPPKQKTAIFAKPSRIVSIAAPLRATQARVNKTTVAKPFPTLFPNIPLRPLPGQPQAASYADQASHGCADEQSAAAIELSLIFKMKVERQGEDKLPDRDTQNQPEQKR
jgi:hypothetical protein